MAYSYSERKWYVDAVDVVTHRPVWVSKIVFYPNAIGDSINFRSWHPQGTRGTTEQTYVKPYDNPPVPAGKGYTLYAPTSWKKKATASITNSKTITSTGNFTSSDVSSLDIIRVLYTEDATNYRATSGPSGGGLGGYYVVLTRDNDNAVTLGNDPLANETSKLWDWQILSDIEDEVTINALKTGGSDTIVQGAVSIDFPGRGRWFPNLFVRSLSASSKADIYLSIR